MSSRKHREVLAWLGTEPPIDELVGRFPEEWDALRREAARREVIGDDALRDYVRAALRPLQESTDHARPAARIVADEIRRRMLLELMRQADVAAETRQSGVIRFNRTNGSILQRIFFDGPGLRRKPASLFAYRVAWPLLPQRRLLLPLVRRRGIYCFYSRRFIRTLVRIVDGRPCAEIAAGDGTLARFLRTKAWS